MADKAAEKRKEEHDEDLKKMMDALNPAGRAIPKEDALKLPHVTDSYKLEHGIIIHPLAFDWVLGGGDEDRDNQLMVVKNGVWTEAEED